MRTKIVDASVMATWLFGEPRQDEAYHMMQETFLMAPQLLPYELSNVAHIKSQKSPEEVGNIRKAFSEFFKLEDLNLVTVDFQAVFSLAFQKSITAYDASYLHLSRALEVPLLTFDQELLKHTS